MCSQFRDAKVCRADFRRKQVEFYCAECDHCVYVHLSLHLNGNHIMHCPNCGHRHYRVIKDGVITSDRFSEQLPIASVIRPVKSAAVPREKRRYKGEIAKVREGELTGEYS